MRVQMTSTNKAIAAMVVFAVIAGVFWTQLLSPKREEVKELGADVERLEASLAQHEAEVVEAEAAREEFPTQYQRLVVLGKAVPRDEDVASLLVQVNRIADGAEGTFREIKLSPAGGEAPEAAAAAPAGEAPASPTEVSASLMPLGATIGTAGLAVMPYEVTFDGGFFEVAEFIKGLDRLVKTGDEDVSVDGRLVTINGFTLAPDEERGFPWLEASFSLTTYLTPPSGGSAEETPGAAAPSTAVPAATTTGGAP
jgi:hypothetical protein